MISVIIPTIPPRQQMLARALESVKYQEYEDWEVLYAPDLAREGPAVMRNRLMSEARGEWIAFLDDDDEFKRGHLLQLLDFATAHGADYVYPWYDVVLRSGRPGPDPMKKLFGRPWDNNDPHQTTITVLVKAELAKDVGFEPGPVTDPNGGRRFVGGEDYRFTLGCVAAGAKIMHLPNRTWRWHHHGKNTSGMPERW